MTSNGPDGWCGSDVEAVLGLAKDHHDPEAASALIAEILASISDGFIALDAELRVLYFNQAAERLLGRTAADILGQPLFEAFPEAAGSLFEQEYSRAIREERTVTFEAYFGVEPYANWYSIRAHPRRGGLLVYFQVITDRKNTEGDLRRAVESLHAVLEAVPLPIIDLDPGWRVVGLRNPAAERLMGTKGGEVLGRPLPLSPVEGEPSVERLAARVAAGGSVEGVDVTVSRADGDEVRCALYAAAVGGPAAGAVCVLADLSGAKRAEEDRLKLEAQLQHAQKLESLGVLAGGIAHDFSNMLMGVLGNASLALLQLPPESPARQAVEHIETAAVRASELAKQMLAYSGRGRFVVQPLNLSILVDEMRHLVSASISKRATVRCLLDPDLPPVMGDATQIRQIVMNLLTNASDALEDKPGVITVATGAQRVDGRYLQTVFMDEDLAEGQYVFLEVSDTGCGMDQDTKKRIFDPFFTTKFHGRGLGLAAVLGIVRGHGGALKVYSEPGGGSAFKVLFPCAEVEAPEPGSAGGAAPASVTSLRGTVLVADDEAGVRQVAEAALTMAGYNVLLAEDGQEAIDVFREHADKIAAVLLDMTMPRMGGEEAFRELRAISPDVKVILSSGFNEQDAITRFVGKGLAGFLQKPYRPQELYERLRQVLGGEGPDA